MGNKTMKNWSFPVKLTTDEVDGGFVVTFPDLPEAITQGETISDCLLEAVDCLEESIAARIDDHLDIPNPSSCNEGEYSVSLSLPMIFKAAVYLAIREAEISQSQLAQKLNVDEREIQSIINPRQGTNLSIIEKVLLTLGKQINIQIV
jgi:antitoxin HicB